jgi:dihydroxyacetone kinase-like predicted kinase
LTISEPQSELSGAATELERLRALARGALAALEDARRRIDDLNVYPVPDGDTGTNLALTVQAVVEELERVSVNERPIVLRGVARAALMGARGEAGMILSQIVRGAVEAAPAKAPIDARALAAMLRRASASAHAAVRKPAAGTMLSVIRELAEEAQAAARRETPLSALLPALAQRAEEALERTPAQLTVLADSGVVDAGAAGLVACLRGITAALGGVPETPTVPVLRLAERRDDRGIPRYQYCMSFLLRADDPDAAMVEHRLERLGYVLLVAEQAGLIEVHLHTDDPGAILRVATEIGEVDAVEVENMRR